MPTKPIERLLFSQGGLCFFCQQQLAPTDATVEHLVAIANGGRNGDENIVACCKSLNSLLGRMSLKEKLRVILNQRGAFRCPNRSANRDTASGLPEGALKRVIADLQKRGTARPRTLKTLTSTINNLFQNSLSSQQVPALVNALQCEGIISVTGTHVSYEAIADG